MSAFGQVPARDVLVEKAKTQSGLSDFGDPWLLDNLAALIPALNSEAELTAEGAASSADTIINSLTARLRHVQYLKDNPAIHDEQVEVAAVVVGLPRTGSTMLHRMLSAAPGMTALHWWECRNYTPLPGEKPGNPAPRIAAARAILDWMLEHAPDLMSIHPMSIDQPDEDVIIQGQLFSGTMAEGGNHVPSFARWLMENSRTRSYADLKEILQSLQFQDKSRKGKKWVLKTPSHLMALDAIIETFPDAKIVMTHRDPVQTVPSYCSMMVTLYHMTSTVSKRKIAIFWEQRLKELLDNFMDIRKKSVASAPGRFIDVRYKDLTANPVAVGDRVLGKAGVTVDAAANAAMQQWLEENRRGTRAAHQYSLEEFGFREGEIEELFASYRQEFIL